jgi:hypothetical protein
MEINNYLRVLISLILLSHISCVQSSNLEPTDTSLTRSVEHQAEIDAILQEDAEYKHWRRLYIREINNARLNEDNPAYKFFVLEFLKTYTLNLPVWMEQEPGFVPGLTEQEIIDANITIEIHYHQ